MNINLQFSRGILKQTVENVQKLYPTVEPKNAWVHNNGRGNWEFHYGAFYWYGRAENAFQARSKGWDSWLSQADRLQSLLRAEVSK